MKSTRATLLSSLVILSSFLPVKANDDDIIEASAPLLPAAATVAQNCFSNWSNSTIGATLAVGAGVLIFAGIAIERLRGNNAVALEAQRGVNSINEQNNKRAHQRDDERIYQSWQTRYNEIFATLTVLTGIENLQSLVQNGSTKGEMHKKITDYIQGIPGNTLVSQIILTARDIDAPIDNVLTRLNDFEKEFTQFPENLPFSPNIPALVDITSKIKGRILSEPKVKEEREILLEAARLKRAKEALIVKDESIAKYEQIRTDQKTHEFQQQKRLYEKMHSNADTLWEKQSEFERHCKETMQAVTASNKKQLEVIQAQQEIQSRQQSLVSEQYTACIQKLNNVATQEQLTHGMASLAKALGHESILMTTLATIHQNQNSQHAQLVAQNSERHTA